MRFQDKTVVVTGAASGIGRATALLFAAEGAKVYAADIDEAGLAKTAADSNGSVTTVRCDVCRCEEIKALMDRAAAETGGIDAVFNNAGAGGDMATIDEIEPDGWDRTMHLLLRSVAFGIRYAVPHMIGRKGAAIVNTSSVAAVGPGYSPNAYAVAKAGVLHLTKTSAADLAKYQIRVNAVQPGFINTNIFTTSLEVPPELEAQAKGAIAMMSEAAQPMEEAGHGHPWHTHVGVDPHWRNSVDHLIRATRTVTAACARREKLKGWPSVRRGNLPHHRRLRLRLA